LRALPVDSFKACHYMDGAYFIGVPGVYFTGYDGEVLPRPLYDMLCDQHAGSDVDILVGNLPYEWRLFHNYWGLSQTMGSIDKFLDEYLFGFEDADSSTQMCVKGKLMEHYKDAADYNICPGCDVFKGVEDYVALANDIEATVGAQLLAASAGRGSRYRYLFDSTGSGVQLGATHAEDVNYFCHAPGSCDGTGNSSEAKIALGKEFRRRFINFARTGAPTAGDMSSAEWPEVDKAQGSLAVPVLHMKLGLVSTLEKSAWFNNEAASSLADIACGRHSISSLGCVTNAFVVV